MPRLRFDLGLWLCCSAIAIVIFCVPDFIEYVNGHLDLGKLRIYFAIAIVGGMLTGLVAQLGLIRLGFRMSGRPPDQADDYDEATPAPPIP